MECIYVINMAVKIVFNEAKKKKSIQYMNAVKAL